MNVRDVPPGRRQQPIKTPNEPPTTEAKAEEVTCDKPQVDSATQTCRDNETSSSAINHAMRWLRGKVCWGAVRTMDGQAEGSDVFPSVPDDPAVPEQSTDRSPETLDTISDPNSQSAFEWSRGLFSKSPDSPSGYEPCPATESETADPEEDVINKAAATIKAQLVNAIVAGIRRVSSERDRDEIIRWFLNARQTLAEEAPKKEIARSLYHSVDTKRFAQLLGNTILTSVREYKGANLPLSLKVALPVTVAGAGFLGFKGAGVAAFGGAIGLPVVLLLFLGTAGTTAIIDAFVKDRDVRDPLTRLLLMLVAFETARRARKEFLDALRADATVPKRADCPHEHNALIEHLTQMDPNVFERHVMSFFEEDGHPVGVTQSRTTLV